RPSGLTNVSGLRSIRALRGASASPHLLHRIGSSSSVRAAASPGAFSSSSSTPTASHTTAGRESLLRPVRTAFTLFCVGERRWCNGQRKEGCCHSRRLRGVLAGSAGARDSGICRAPGRHLRSRASFVCEARTASEPATPPAVLFREPLLE